MLFSSEIPSAPDPALAAFGSILFGPGESPTAALPQDAPFLSDLHLHQVINTVTADKGQYNLKLLFYSPLAGVADINYRHQNLQELETGPVRTAIETFAHQIQAMRNHLALEKQLQYKRQHEALFVDAAEAYSTAVSTLSTTLAHTDLQSPGFRALRDYVGSYVAADTYRALVVDTKRLKDDLAGVQYCLRLKKGGRVQVTRYRGEPDYTAEVKETFQRFRQGAVKDYRINYRPTIDMNHVEAMVLERVARLFPAAFEALDQFCERHAGFADPLILRFDREVQFYLAYLDHIDVLRRAGLPFCYPAVSSDSKDLVASETFDLALAEKLVSDGEPVVRNDFRLDHGERIFIVSGPNQGGKTTFARTVGQLHYLASLGLPVPGTEARLFLPDRIFTHFERGENLTDLRGKLMDDLIRVHDILADASSNSLVILNEIFTSTTLADAVELGRRVMEQVMEKDSLCVCVTFVDELAALSGTTVSMASTVVPADPAIRTFKVIRKPADGLAYARVLAEKYGLTYAQLKEGLGS